AASPPLRIDDPDFKGHVIAPLRTLESTRRPVSVRRSFRRAGLDAPNVFGLPESAHVAAGDSWSHGSFSTFKGKPRLDRKHISPPTTGPPTYRPSWTIVSDPRAIASTADTERRPPQATLRQRVPRKPP
ncbi:MAG TPA: hypothetical protein VGJ64_00705, partial [Gemmatimonadaceae bacterium]